MAQIKLLMNEIMKSWKYKLLIWFNIPDRIAAKESVFQKILNSRERKYYLRIKEGNPSSRTSTSLACNRCCLLIGEQKNRSVGKKFKPTENFPIQTVLELNPWSGEQKNRSVAKKFIPTENFPIQTLLELNPWKPLPSQDSPCHSLIEDLMKVVKTWKRKQ